MTNQEEFIRILNIWNEITGTNIYIQGGKPGPSMGPLQTNGSADQWRIIPVDDGWVKLQNREDPENYLHNQNGHLEVGPIQNEWVGSMWKIVPIGSDKNRIQSRKNPEHFIHNQSAPFSKIESGPIQINWNSAMWRLKAVVKRTRQGGGNNMGATNSISLYEEHEAPPSHKAYMGYYLGGPMATGLPEIENKPFTFEVFFKAELDANGIAKGGSLLSNISLTNPNGANSMFDKTFYFFSTIVAIDLAGKLRFGIADNTTWSAMMIKTDTIIKDDIWHHVAAIRTEKELLLYLDGELQKCTVFPLRPELKFEDIRFDILFFKIGANTKNYYGKNLGNGQGLFPLAQGVPEQFSGKIGEFRIWNRDLTTNEILSGSAKMPTGNEPGLAMYNKFTAYDPDALEQKNYEIESEVGPKLLGPAKLNESGPQLLSSQSSYLIVQTNLMEDYKFGTGDQVEDVTNFRAVITAKLFNGDPIKNETIIIQTVEGGAHLLSDQSQTPQAELILQSNASGQVSFTIEALGLNELFAPAVRARSSFMGEEEWTVISLDKQAHSILSNLTGDMLKARAPIGDKRNDQPLVNMDDQTNNALADSVSHLMRAATEHSVHSYNPNRRRGNDVIDHYLQKTPAHPYENAFISDKSFSVDNDVASSFYATHEHPTEQESHIRTINASSMSNPHWGFKHDTENSTASFETYANIAVAHQETTGSELIFLNDAAAYLHPQHSKKRIIELSDLNTALRESQSNDTWFDSLYNKVELSEHIIVHTATHFVEEAKKDIRVVVVTAIVVEAGVKKAFTAVVQKVEHTAKITKALFGKFGAEASHVIHYIKSVFNWSDILLSQKYAAHHIDQSLEYIKHYVSQEEQKIIAGLDTIKNSIDDKLSDLSHSFLKGSIGDHKNKASYHPAHGVRQGYVHRLVSDHMGSTDTTYAFDDKGKLPGGSIDGKHEQFKNSVDTHLGALLADPEKLGKMALAEVVRAVKFLLDEAVELIKTGLEDIFDALERAIEGIRDLLNAKLTIPYLTPLFKHITEGEDLSILNLVSLTGAVPFTIAYKAINNISAPYTQAEVDNFITVTWEQFDEYYKPVHTGQKRNETTLQMTENPDNIKLLKASWGVGFIFSASVFVQGILTSINDIKVVPPSFEAGILGQAQVALESITQVLAFPFTLFTADKAGPWVLDMTIWFFQLAPLTVPYVQRPYEITAGEGFVWKLSYGAMHFLSFIGLGIWEIDKARPSDVPDLIMKMVANVASTVPELDIGLLFFPDEKAHIAKATIDEIMFLAWTGLTIARTAVDIEEQKLTVIR